MANCCNTPEQSNLAAADACAAVAPVFLAYEAQLKGFVQKRVLDKTEADDILQQLYLKVYKHCEQLQEVNNTKAWLYQITRNAVYDFFRENSRRERLEDLELAEEELPENSRHEIEALIEPLIGLLPAEYAEALRLSELEGVSQKEIAERLGISYSGAKSRVQRGREKLKALFMECCHLEFSHDGHVLWAQVKASCKPLQGLKTCT
ncbi:RNA polymerase sigma (SigZ) subunit [Pontibacter ummariensis]|uniref:RNA polymerase sigma factor SigZ n=1 Tax=Pontibacter ummariensis TaxID=1610492 RepID=A0A239DZN9_9BACT|nr:RNA polymerase sigma factor SigZ [Pontibacter ummariensis]PRY13672.1 RNA polymerase sigma (SigZ) subunit [Pontibacter ummariensis]SNS37827.1 RNA polymerase, sigma subunit, SigZ [Pontibacter ummariensis]